MLKLFASWSNQPPVTSTRKGNQRISASNGPRLLHIQKIKLLLRVRVANNMWMDCSRSVKACNERGVQREIEQSNWKE